MNILLLEVFLHHKIKKHAMEEGGILIFIVVFIVGILITRAFGAWMLRINDVISELKEINRKLDKRNL